mmetsp:Transcript_32089/g.78179  ORF Transcript_32089/g.78179 Transcript_32089/m.78179 type:complete len:85 (-) Transcript_32089:1347-1601(-)
MMRNLLLRLPQRREAAHYLTTLEDPENGTLSPEAWTPLLPLAPPATGTQQRAHAPRALPSTRQNPNAVLGKDSKTCQRNLFGIL